MTPMTRPIRVSVAGLWRDLPAIHPAPRPATSNNAVAAPIPKRLSQLGVSRVTVDRPRLTKPLCSHAGVVHCRSYDLGTVAVSPRNRSGRYRRRTRYGFGAKVSQRLDSDSGDPLRLRCTRLAVSMVRYIDGG